MIVTIVLTTIVMGLCWIFYRQRREKMMVFKKLGIPGPEPNFLFGNLMEFRTTPLYEKQMQWREKYGETYGYFEGPTPVLVTSNVDMLQEVFIKQFNKFHTRKLWPVQADPDHDEDVHLFFARGRRWKRLRNIVTPAFSQSKMKSMAPTVNDCINHLLDVIRDQSKDPDVNNQSVEVLELFRRMTLDTILRCEMGIDQNSVKNPDDPFLRHCKGVIDDTANTPWLYTLGFVFPALHVIWMAVYRLLHNIQFNPVFWIEARMREVVNLRRNRQEDRSDLMQQMLKAKLNVDHFKDIDVGEDEKMDCSSKLVKSMTNEEIVSHALLFLLAGYETTSTTLAYVFYELSQNPNVQHQLRQEVMTVLPRGYNSIEFEDLKKFKYLDYVIWETLRKYPLASTVTARQCTVPCTIGGFDIPAGMLVHANLWDVQYDPKHWGENTQVFDPLRFIPQKRATRHPMAWMPFGGGPRACVGIRFAYLQLKMVVAKLLRDFDFHPTVDLAGQPLNLMQGATICPQNGVRLSAMRRGSAMSDSETPRRGSIMASLGLDDWNTGRRQSVKEEEEDDDNDAHTNLGADEFMNAQNRRRGSNPNITVSQDRLSRQCSEAFEDNEKPEKITRKDSILTGFELLRRASLTKGIELLLKSSNLDLSSDGERSRRSSLDGPFILPFNTSCFESLFDDAMSKPKRMSRRGSAFPVLESVGEGDEVTRFMPPVSGQLGKDTTWQRKTHSNRLASRRGSG